MSNTNLTYRPFFKPQMAPGKYLISAKQHGSAKETEFTYDAEDKFVVVTAERFLFSPDLIETTYPGNGEIGSYQTILPHITLNRKTLPWERRVDSDVMQAGYDADTLPKTWLAVLVLDEEDFESGVIPQATAGQVSDLLKSDRLPEDIFFPEITIDPDLGEHKTDPCMFIDLPVQLFNQIAPALSDLQWIASGRSVNISDKTTPRYGGRKYDSNSQFYLKEGQPYADYANIMANRFPKAGNVGRAILVSLELFGSVLRPNQVDETLYSHVRLVQFFSWDFETFEAQDDFEHQILSLNNQHTQSPWLTVPKAQHSEASNSALDDAIQMGYVPLNHLTRAATIADQTVTPNHTVSWYRTPFVSFNLSDTLVSIESELPFGSADALSRYNPNTGMFDMTYAAAFQLGELLALNDRNYATQLYQYKRNQLKTTIDAFEKDSLNEALGISSTDNQPSQMYQILTGKSLAALDRFHQHQKQNKRPK